MVGTGLDGSFVPCAEAGPTNIEMQNVMVKMSTDARIVLPSSSGNV
jgi:hypothetical protein